MSEENQECVEIAEETVAVLSTAVMQPLHKVFEAIERVQKGVLFEVEGAEEDAVEGAPPTWVCQFIPDQNHRELSNTLQEAKLTHTMNAGPATHSVHELSVQGQLPSQPGQPIGIYGITSLAMEGRPIWGCVLVVPPGLAMERLWEPLKKLQGDLGLRSEGVTSHGLPDPTEMN